MTIGTGSNFSQNESAMIAKAKSSVEEMSLQNNKQQENDASKNTISKTNTDITGIGGKLDIRV